MLGFPDCCKTSEGAIYHHNCTGLQNIDSDHRPNRRSSGPARVRSGLASGCPALRTD